MARDWRRGEGGAARWLRRRWAVSGAAALVALGVALALGGGGLIGSAGAAPVGQGAIGAVVAQAGAPGGGGGGGLGRAGGGAGAGGGWAHRERGGGAGGAGGYWGGGGAGGGAGVAGGAGAVRAGRVRVPVRESCGDVHRDG